MRDPISKLLTSFPKPLTSFPTPTSGSFSIVFLISALCLVNAQTTDDSASTNTTGSTGDSGGAAPTTFGTLFSDMTETNLALLIVVCVIIAGILGYLVRQGVKSQARLKQVRAAEVHYSVHHFDKQALGIPHQNHPPDPFQNPPLDHSQSV